MARAGITLTARRPAGLFWGTQTLRQLLPAAIEADTRQPGPWRIALGTIHDRPRFAWRGAMLDVARHFFGVDEVKRLIDLMALYKLNRLHLHLTDDQGWRIAIRSWPQADEPSAGGPQVGGGRGGYFTQREYARDRRVRPRAIRRRRARDRHAGSRQRRARVLPEAHLRRRSRPRRYTGIEVGFSSLCIRKELTYAFVDDVVREVAALTPGPYLHIGGDEAHSTDPDEYRVFVERVQRDRARARQADDRLGGDREDAAPADVGRAALARPRRSRDAPSSRARS